MGGAGKAGFIATGVVVRIPYEKDPRQLILCKAGFKQAGSVMTNSFGHLSMVVVVVVVEERGLRPSTRRSFSIFYHLSVSAPDNALAIMFVQGIFHIRPGTRSSPSLHILTCLAALGSSIWQGTGFSALAARPSASRGTCRPGRSRRSVRGRRDAQLRPRWRVFCGANRA